MAEPLNDQHEGDMTTCDTERIEAGRRDRLRDLGEAIQRREDEERAVHEGQPCDLAALLEEAKRRGFNGFCVLPNFGPMCVATFISREGKILTLETTYSAYATPEGALSALLATSRAK